MVRLVEFVLRILCMTVGVALLLAYITGGQELFYVLLVLVLVLVVWFIGF